MFVARAQASASGIPREVITKARGGAGVACAPPELLQSSIGTVLNPLKAIHQISEPVTPAWCHRRQWRCMEALPTGDCSWLTSTAWPCCLAPAAVSFAQIAGEESAPCEPPVASICQGVEALPSFAQSEPAPNGALALPRTEAPAQAGRDGCSRVTAGARDDVRTVDLCAGPHPGVAVIHEVFGDQPEMRTVCDDFARQGYVAAMPDPSVAAGLVPFA